MSNQDDALMFAAEIGADVPTLDLHGYSRREAEDAVDQFLDRQFFAGEKVVKIIHGRGTGALRATVQSMLGTHAHVKTYRESDQPHQIGGTTVVRLDV